MDRLPAVVDAREAKLRADWVKTMEARLVREELAKCWREEGVNHYQSCHALSEKYLDMIRTHRVGCTLELELCKDAFGILMGCICDGCCRSLDTGSSITPRSKIGSSSSKI